MAEKSELHRAKNGVAILATCIVQTLNESDPTFQDRFLERLSRAYRELKDNTDGDVKGGALLRAADENEMGKLQSRSP